MIQNSLFRPDFGFAMLRPGVIAVPPLTSTYFAPAPNKTSAWFLLMAVEILWAVAAGTADMSLDALNTGFRFPNCGLNPTLRAHRLLRFAQGFREP